VLALFSVAQGQSDSGTGSGGRIILPDGLTLRPHAYAHLESGQIESGNVKNDDFQANGSKYGIDHVWTEDGDIEFGFASTYRERFDMDVSIGAKLYFSYPIFFSHDKNTKYLRTDPYFDQAYAKYSWGPVESSWLSAQVGYFKFKYNPDVRNLGEYMFRTGTYPIYFDMSFDAPFQRLLGIHLQDNFLDNSLKIDWLLASATLFPTMNWSAAVLANYDVAGLHFLNIGAGVDFADLLDVYTKSAFPSYGGDPTSLTSTTYNNRYVGANGDTNFYTFQGTKVMGRLSIDPKTFFKWRFLGENDLKLYAEADLIGVQNYPDSGLNPAGQKVITAPSYDSILQRIPVSVGFNFPTYPLFAYGVAPELLLWKLQGKYDVVPQISTTLGCLVAGAALSWLQERFHINSQLDVLNLEMEYFGAKYYNDASNVNGKGDAPLPYSVNIWGDPGAPRKSDVKWSVYAKKSFLNGHFSVAAQVGLDHLRLSTPAYDYEYWNEMLVTSNDWWWVLKTSWMF
jgi:hypothetical protein